MKEKESGKLRKLTKRREAKLQQGRQQSKYRKTNENSTRAKPDYASHDGPTIADVPSDVPQSDLEYLMINYYRSKVDINYA